MHRAALDGHTAAVSLLLEQGADIEAKNNVSNLTYHDYIHCYRKYCMYDFPWNYPTGCCDDALIGQLCQKLLK